MQISRHILGFLATNNRASWDVLCVTACFISLPSKFPCTTGCSLSDQHILSPKNLKYDDWFPSDLQRLMQIVLRKFDENYTSYFGLIGEKICWSDIEQPVVHGNLDGREMKQAVTQRTSQLPLLLVVAGNSMA